MLLFQILIRVIVALFILGLLAYHGYILYYFLTSQAPHVGSFNSQLKLIKQLDLQKGRKLVDLGCGSGKALRFFVREFTLDTEGYDVNRFAIMTGKLKNLKIIRSNRLKIKFFNKNFEKANLSTYDYVYMYLRDSQLTRMEDWFFDAIRDDTVVISNTFQFKKHKPFKIIKDKKGKDRIFLYRK